MLTLLTLLAGLTPLLAPAADPADTLKPARIPADARWVAHVDIPAALASTLVRQLIEQEGHVTLDGPEWDEVRLRLDIDPLTDLTSVTVYGSSDTPDDAVALIATNTKIENALVKLHQWLTETTVDVGGVGLSHWKETGGRGDDEFYSYVASRADTDERLLMVSPDAERLAAGVAVLRGAAPNLAGQGASLHLTPRPGTIVYVAAPEGLARFLDLDDAPQVARLATSLDVQLGEHAGRFFAELEVQTDHTEAVQQASSILQGATALAGLLSQDEPEIRPFLPLLQGLRFEASDRTLRIHFEHDARALADLIHAHAGEQDERSVPEPEPRKMSKPRAPLQGEGWR